MCFWVTVIVVGSYQPMTVADPQDTDPGTDPAEMMIFLFNQRRPTQMRQSRRHNDLHLVPIEIPQHPTLPRLVDTGYRGLGL